MLIERWNSRNFAGFLHSSGRDVSAGRSVKNVKYVQHLARDFCARLREEVA
jgi:hypothetical protein